MKIAICDDENVFVQKLYQYLWKQLDCSVECFTSPIPLLEKYRAKERYDVLFLDILMSPINGIELAKEIRLYDQNAVIVFLTVSLEYAPLGYEVNAFRYLLKPVSEEDFLNTMQQVREKLAERHTLRISTPECDLLLHTEKLCYLEADNKDSILYYMDDTITVCKSLNSLSKLLPERCFFRVHRKYIVNLACIREFDGKNLTLDCRITLPVSRRRSADFNNVLNRYIKGDFR